MIFIIRRRDTPGWERSFGTLTACTTYPFWHLSQLLFSHSLTLALIALLGHPSLQISLSLPLLTLNSCLLLSARPLPLTTSPLPLQDNNFLLAHNLLMTAYLMVAMLLTDYLHTFDAVVPNDAVREWAGGGLLALNLLDIAVNFTKLLMHLPYRRLYSIVCEDPKMRGKKKQYKEMQI
jgi:hypothetical protein